MEIAELETEKFTETFKKISRCLASWGEDVVQEAVTEYLARKADGLSDSEAMVFAVVKGKGYARREMDFRNRRQGGGSGDGE